MPLTRISLRRGKPAAYRRAVADNVYAAMRETFEVPDDDRFMVVTEHDETDFTYGRHYLGIDRSDDLLIIQLTVSNTRTVDRRRPCTERSSNASPKTPACARRMSSSAWSKSARRTGRSGTAKRSTPERRGRCSAPPSAMQRRRVSAKPYSSCRNMR